MFYFASQGYDKWLVQRENAIYYDYKVIQSDDGGATAWQTKHGSDYHKDYFPGNCNIH
jgi:hypothetical protein